MKSLLIILLCVAAMFATPLKSHAQAAQVQTSQVVQSDVSDQQATITLPALPVKGASIWDWIKWGFGVLLAIDIVTRFVPTQGKYAWVTKVIGFIHDILLYLDNTKKQPDSKS